MSFFLIKGSFISFGSGISVDTELIFIELFEILKFIIFWSISADGLSNMNLFVFILDDSWADVCWYLDQFILNVEPIEQHEAANKKSSRLEEFTELS